MRKLLLVLLLLLSLPLPAQRRRSALPPAADLADPVAWLRANAIALHSAEPIGTTRDLTPLRDMIGTARILGLGDGTHGTREFYLVKLRILEFLASETDFRAVAIEAPYRRVKPLNAYVLGGPGDPRALTAPLNDNGYFFWSYEEFVQVLEWMRAYNATHDNKFQIAGIDDYFDNANMQNEVVTFLQTADPTLGADAAKVYDDCNRRVDLARCITEVVRVRDLISTRFPGEPAHYAAMIAMNWQGATRDEMMAEAALRLRSTHTKLVLWAHELHLGKTRSPIAGTDIDVTGIHLARSLGDDYFVIGNATLAGTFTSFDPIKRAPVQKTFDPATPQHAESTFVQARRSPMLIPLRNAPQWFVEPRRIRAAGGGPSSNNYTWELTEELAKKYDALIFIEETRATTPIQR